MKPTLTNDNQSEEKISPAFVKTSLNHNSKSDIVIKNGSLLLFSGKHKINRTDLLMVEITIFFYTIKGDNFFYFRNMLNQVISLMHYFA